MMKLETRPLFLLPFLLVLLVPGCKDDTAGPGRVVTTITVTPENPSVADGATLQLTATLRDQHGQPFTTLPAGVSVAWSSGDAAVAAVNGSGLVTGERPGQAEITASAGGASGSTAATVTQVATGVELLSGNAQTGTENAALPEAIAVRVLDRHGDPVAGVAVEWAVTGGGGSLAPLSSTTDESGGARATWTLGAVGTNTAGASAGVLEGSPVAFTAEALSTNQPPVAQDDVATTPFATPVVIDVLANDSDPDGDPLTVESVTTPANGTATINGDQTVTYTPNSGFSGTDSFGYTISDGQGHTASATVTVTVQAPVLACNPIANFNKTWQGSVSSDWSNAGNWSPVGAPVAADNVYACLAAPNYPVLSQAGVANNVEMRAPLTLGGNTLTVNGNFTAASTGLLTLDHSSDLLIIGGDAAFNGGFGAAAVLSAGEIRVGGNFNVLHQNTSFNSTGTRVVFDGSSVQTVSTPGSPLVTTAIFRDVEITNPAGVEFIRDSRVGGSVMLAVTSGNVTSSGNRTVVIGGDLVDATGNRWRVENTWFTGSPSLPAEMTTNITFGRAPGPAVHAILTGDFAVTGSLTVHQPSNLVLNGHQVHVRGSFSNTQAGILTMKNSSDRLIIEGDASFASGGVTRDTLSAGEIRVAGNFSTTFSNTFPSTGTRVVLNGTAAQTVTITNPNTSPFHDLQITNPAGVEFLSDAAVNGDLNLVGQMTVPSSRTLTIVETLFLRAASVLNNQGTIHVAACEKEAGHTINGTDPCP
jgi:hypothetical protein